MGFGPVTRYVQVETRDFLKMEHNNEEKGRKWDCAVDEASAQYDEEMHNLLCNNCHSHVAVVLNDVQYLGYTSWNTVALILLVFFLGRFVSFKGFLKTYLPSVLLWVVVIVCALVLR
eukprot:TRINITY_DN2025_c0_g1_i10.p1 TRINITY_DN2025_c0_g1~~TRINITY_DN2025_c0_g1_i10.p1  ORF type:complete len:117 (+),score=14.44 TRINITY_DN2025_c0_g1_i10:435-785(+)